MQRPAIQNCFYAALFTALAGLVSACANSNSNSTTPPTLFGVTASNPELLYEINPDTATRRSGFGVRGSGFGVRGSGFGVRPEGFWPGGPGL